jgi:WD40 repeat protein
VVDHRSQPDRREPSGDKRHVSAQLIEEPPFGLQQIQGQHRANPAPLENGVPEESPSFGHDRRHRTLVASGGGDGTIRLWDAATGQPIGEPLRGQEGQVNSLAFSPDGRVLASGGGDGTIRLWDAATGQPIGEPLRGHEDSVYRVAFSPDGTTVAAANSLGVIHRWDVETGEAISETRLRKSAEQWRSDTGLRRRFGVERQPPASATPN